MYSPPFPFLNAFAGTVVTFQENPVPLQCCFMADSGNMIRGSMTRADRGVLGGRECLRVLAVVSANDVVLAAPGCWPVHECWNRWPGRIVFAEWWKGMSIITVKVVGHRWSLKSVGSVLGQDRRPRVWDAVTIAIDPDLIYIKPYLTELSHLRPRMLQQSSS